MEQETVSYNEAGKRRTPPDTCNPSQEQFGEEALQNEGRENRVKLFHFLMNMLKAQEAVRNKTTTSGT